MKIKSVTVHAIRLPLKNPFTVSYHSYEDMPSIIVKMETDDGMIGFGEAVPDEHVTGETWETTYYNLLHYIIPVILNESPYNIEKIHSIMNSTLYGMPAAKAAIDIACYDLIGKKADEPIYNFLGGQFHPHLSVPYVIGINTPDEMAKEAMQAMGKGCDNFKLKVGTDPMKDIQRIRSVRQAVGENVHIRLDANQGWRNSVTALQVLSQIEDCGIEAIEQPVLASNYRALAEVRQKSIIPVMADESLHGPAELSQLISLQAVDLINIKLMKCGGIYPALKLVHQAEMAGIESMIGSMIESSIATAAGAHLAMSKENIVMNDLAGPKLFKVDVSPLRYESNTLFLGNASGLGINVNESLINELSIASETVSA